MAFGFIRKVKQDLTRKTTSLSIPTSDPIATGTPTGGASPIAITGGTKVPDPDPVPGVDEVNAGLGAGLEGTGGYEPIPGVDIRNAGTGEVLDPNDPGAITGGPNQGYREPKPTGKRAGGGGGGKFAIKKRAKTKRSFRI